MSIVTLTATKFVAFIGSLVFGGLLSTGVTGGAIAVPEFTTGGLPSRTAKAVIEMPVNAFVTATGSQTIDYPAACVRNPLRNLALGSGRLLDVSYQTGNNPRGVGADIGFTKGCSNAFGSGSDVINDTCSSTGCVSTYTTGTALWNDADYLKLTFRDFPGAGYTGRIRLTVQDVFGE